MHHVIIQMTVTTSGAVPAALIALWLDRHTARRDARARAGGYYGRTTVGWQAWQRGLYDIRDWAGSARTYLSYGNTHGLELGTIRVPGHRYLAHIVSSGRVAEDDLQPVLILSEYCDILVRSLAHVLAADLIDGPHRGGLRRDEFLAMTRGDDPGSVPALVQLARAVEEMAQDLADPSSADIHSAL